jgi:polyhydroxybutyrate depolymerase
MKENQIPFLICLAAVIMLACGQTTPSIITPPENQRITATTSDGQTPASLTPEQQVFEPVPSGDATHSMSLGGQERTYILHVPPTYDPSQLTPLVIIFHGFGLDAEEMIRITGFNAQADLSGFLAAYPNGTGRKSSWNGGDCCGEAAVKNVDDVGFVRAMIEEISQSINLDRKRIYATGFSNGAIMSYRLACDLSDRIAAIGPVSATQNAKTCQPSRPISVIHFHGTNDKLNPYEGGTSSGSVEFPSVKDTIQLWIRINGCPTPAQSSESGNIVHETFSPCAQGTAIELYTINGGEHAWPGGESVSSEIGEPTTEISATHLMWEFFNNHPMP